MPSRQRNRWVRRVGHTVGAAFAATLLMATAAVAVPAQAASAAATPLRPAVPKLTAPAQRANAPATPLRPALPRVTGPYEVGRATLHLIDRDRLDPWKQDRKRELMTTVTYPARFAERYPRSPWFSSAIASYLEENLADPLGLAPGSVDFAGARAQARTDAPVARPPSGRADRGWPVVLFSPGFGASRELNAAQIEDLASRGYLVVSFDHTYEAPAVEFPGGRVVEWVPEILSSDPQVGKAVAKLSIDSRVADTRFVLDQLDRLDRGRNPDAEHRRLPVGLRRSLDLSHLGMLGYSYGGYTAGESMFNDPRIDAGVDLDGTLAHGWEVTEDWPYLPGEFVKHGLDRPFMLFGRQGNSHVSIPLAGDPSWADFWSNQRGWKLDITLRRSMHGSFEDLQTLGPQILRAFSLPADTLEAAIGAVDPDRSIAAQRAYIAAFFQLHLRHRNNHLLDGPSQAFPEIEFVP